MTPTLTTPRPIDSDRDAVLALVAEDRVTPCVVGAVVCALVKSSVLVATGEWEWSDDTRSRNAGKPVQRYAWSAPVERAA